MGSLKRKGTVSKTNGEEPFQAKAEAGPRRLITGANTVGEDGVSSYEPSEVLQEEGGV